jgi:AmmeMemoRadiSam system protein B
MSQVHITDQPGLVRAIIVPHAGYRHCIQTSLHAFAQVKPDLYDRVFVLGPSHRVRIRCCTIADADCAESPYGEIPFDSQVVAELVGSFPRLFEKLDLKTAEIEHSLEMEFPILKFIFREKTFQMIPIMIGGIDFEKCGEVAAALSAYADRRTLFVISSDFCHWGDKFRYTYLPEGPGEIYERIEKLDRLAAERISTGNPDEFTAYLDETKNTICGRRAILIMMNIFREGNVEWPHYSHSSNITSRDESAVSYMAGVVRTV